MTNPIHISSYVFLDTALTIYPSIYMRRRYLYILLFLCHDPIHLSFYFNDTPLSIYRSISMSRPYPFIVLFLCHAPIYLSFYFYDTTTYGLNYLGIMQSSAYWFYCHDITEILLKVALNTIALTLLVLSNTRHTVRLSLLEAVIRIRKSLFPLTIRSLKDCCFPQSFSCDKIQTICCSLTILAIS